MAPHLCTPERRRVRYKGWNEEAIYRWTRVERLQRAARGIAVSEFVGNAHRLISLPISPCRLVMSRVSHTSHDSAQQIAIGVGMSCHCSA